jgi:citrate lyase subunit beta/citryl-CoA lyase
VLATSTLVRRSVLLVPLRDSSTAWRHNADAIALDLDGASRTALPEAIRTARQGGAEIFVRIDKSVAYADIKASAIPELTGVILPNPESVADINEVADILQERERKVGIPSGKLEIFPLIGTAKGVWNVREIINASPRIRCVALDETALCQSLGIGPTEDFDALTFSRGRVIVETLAAVRLPLGIGHPLGALPRETDEAELLQMAERARNTGFKGAVCPLPSWVAMCNRAFTPTDEQVAYYRDVRTAFAKGVARGTAAVPFPGGRMIDVPVDERAKLVIDWWERCQRRDAEKAAATRATLAGQPCQADKAGSSSESK